MRIDAYNQVAQIYQAAKSKSAQGKEKAADSADMFQISQVGKELQTARQAISKVPDVREDKVNDVRERFAAGTYNVTGEQLADKLINKYYNNLI